MLALIGNTYVNYLLDKEMRAREFEFLRRLLQIVPVRQVTPHCDPRRLLDLCELIEKDVLPLSAGSARA